MSKKIRVVVCVEGGNVVSAYADKINAKDIDLEIVDYDNLEAEGKTREEATVIGLKATEGLKDIL